MSVDDHREWVRYAEQDWQLATSLLRRKRPPTVAICFHAQQMAESKRMIFVVAPPSQQSSL